VNRLPVLVHNPARIVGGAETGLLNVLQVMSAAWSPTVIVPCEGELSKAVRARGWGVEVVGMHHGLLTVGRHTKSWFRLFVAACALLPHLRRVRRSIGVLGPKLLYSNGIKSHYILCLSAFGQGIPLVCHVRDIMGSVFGLRWLLSKVAAGVIANSQATAVALGLEGVGVEVVPNCLDLEKFDKAKDAPLSRELDTELRGERAVVVAAGKLVPLKGFQDLIDAMVHLRRRCSAAKLIIAGSEGYDTQSGHGERLRARVSELSLDDSVSFVGELSSLAPLLKRADVVAVPSHSEGFGRVALEAMAAGSCVVATETGGLCELIDDGVDGLLVSRRDPVALADGLARVLENPELSRNWTRAARARVEREHTLGVLAKRMDAAIASFCPSAAKGGARG